MEIYYLHSWLCKLTFLYEWTLKLFNGIWGLGTKKKTIREKWWLPVIGRTIYSNWWLDSMWKVQHLSNVIILIFHKYYTMSQKTVYMFYFHKCLIWFSIKLENWKVVGKRMFRLSQKYGSCSWNKLLSIWISLRIANWLYSCLLRTFIHIYYF